VRVHRSRAHGDPVHRVPEEETDMTTTSTTYDPASTAASLAKAYTDGRQTLLTKQTSAAQATSAALTKLQSALSSFDSALLGLSSKANVLAQSATFSDASIGSATASPGAAAGNYGFFVEQLATASQVAYAGVAAAPAASQGTLAVDFAGGASFAVDLAAGDLDHDGVLSTTELASAINHAAGNGGLVTAAVVTVNGASQLLLTSTATGSANGVSLDTSAVAAGALKTALDNGNTLAAAKDAIVWLGAQGTGLCMQQASNTFTNVAGLSVSFTKAMAAGTPPVTLAVATDGGSTADNVRAFVSAWNTLNSALNALTDSGDASSNVAPAVLAEDSGVRALRDRLTAVVREQVGGVSLTNYGVTGNRDGSLSLDASRLQARLAVDPDGLATVFGSTRVGAKSGVLGDLDTLLGTWTNPAGGQIAKRRDSVVKLQQELGARQASLDDQYNAAYQRYLAQFSALQSLQSRMGQTSNMFDALFSSSKG
jgi:flagellar hook-associated protein 2